MPLDKDAASANLIAWAQAGVTVVRDVGPPGGVTLEISSPGPGLPALQAAGRFLAPAGRYFPDLAAGTGTEGTYSIGSIAQLVAAVHKAGARVAVHSTIPDAGQLVAAGVDSIEHGIGLDEAALKEMARRGTAWTPTIGALLALLDAPDLPPARRQHLHEGRERLTQLLPVAARLGVPVLAGTDVTGSIPREVALLSQMGLEPEHALAAASIWPRRFLGITATADIVTYHHDPREDPGQLAHPAAVVAGGTRLR